MRPEFDESDLTVYDQSSMVTRMVGAVKIATAYRDHATMNVSYVGAKDRHSRVTAETVAKRFRCGIETAQKTLKTTTQRGF